MYPLIFRRCLLGNSTISYPESSDFLVSGWAPGKTLGNWNFSCRRISPVKCNGTTYQYPVPQILSWCPNADQKPRGLWVREWARSDRPARLLTIYLPTFSESNVWDFRLVMTGISENVTATSEDFRWFPEDVQTLPKMSEDDPMKWFPVPQIQMQTETRKF